MLSSFIRRNLLEAQRLQFECIEFLLNILFIFLNVYRFLFIYFKTKVSQNRETLSIIRDLQTEINALFKRSDIPRSEFPKTSKTTEISVSDEEVSKSIALLSL